MCICERATLISLLKKLGSLIFGFLCLFLMCSAKMIPPDFTAVLTFTSAFRTLNVACLISVLVRSLNFSGVG